MSFTIKKISVEETYGIRLEVLRKGIDLPYKFQGDTEATTFHVGAFEGDELVGVATFMKSSHEFFKGAQYQLRGMATLASVRGKGAGKLIVEYAEAQLKMVKTEILWCNARVEATAFYEKLGFKTRGELFTVEKVGPHYVMHKEL